MKLMRRSAQGARAARDEATGESIARYTGFVRGVAWTTLVLGVGASAFVVTHQASAHDVLVAVLSCGAFLAVAAAMVMEFTRVRAAWSAGEVSFTSPWAGSRRLRWNEVAKVDFSRSASWFVVRDRNGTAIRLSTLLGGLGDLLDELKQRTDPAVQSQVDDAISRWKRAGT
jgi:hypothetical protein